MIFFPTKNITTKFYIQTKPRIRSSLGNIVDSGAGSGLLMSVLGSARNCKLAFLVSLVELVPIIKL